MHKYQSYIFNFLKKQVGVIFETDPIKTAELLSASTKISGQCQQNSPTISSTVIYETSDYDLSKADLKLIYVGKKYMKCQLTHFYLQN